MNALLDKLICKLLHIRYHVKRNDGYAVRDALNRIENSYWLVGRGYYKVISADYYHRGRNIMIKNNTLEIEPKKFQFIVIKREKEKEAFDYVRRRGED